MILIWSYIWQINKSKWWGKSYRTCEFRQRGLSLSLVSVKIRNIFAQTLFFYRFFTDLKIYFYPRLISVSVWYGWVLYEYFDHEICKEFLLHNPLERPSREKKCLHQTASWSFRVGISWMFAIEIKRVIAKSNFFFHNFSSFKHWISPRLWYGSTFYICAAISKSGDDSFLKTRRIVIKIWWKTAVRYF